MIRFIHYPPVILHLMWSYPEFLTTEKLTCFARIKDFKTKL